MAYLFGIDASRAVKEKRTGTENYSWYIIRELLKLDKFNEYRLYAPHLPGEDFGTFSNASWKIIPQQRLWSQVALAKEVNTSSPDLLFSPSHVIPLLARVKSLAMVHDLAYKLFPHSYSPLARRYLDFSTQTSINKSSAGLTPSQSTKKDIEKIYKVKNKKIVVTPLGYNNQLFRPDADFDTSPLKEKYIYFVGRIETRKNVSLLIDAFNLLSKENKPVHLVLAGKPGYGYEKIKDKINSLPAQTQAKIHELGFISDQDSAKYLKHADIFAFPSLYEGFGLPILEALAMGTPTISSSTSSLPEITGDAAILLPPTDALTWAASMSRIIHQKDLADNLRKKGIEQAKKFNWQTTAKQTLEVLEYVANR